MSDRRVSRVSPALRRVAASLALLTAVVALFVAIPGPETRAAGSVRFVDAFPGVTFSRPVFAVEPPPPSAGPGIARMFVVEQAGKIWTVPHTAGERAVGTLGASKTLFLDISAAVSRAGNEEGLLGFAFHPQFETNGRFFVHYSAKYTSGAQRRNVLSEFRVASDDPLSVVTNSERVLLTVSQPFTNHNGGWIGFANDGMLFVSLGDGGSGGDPQGNGQDLGTLLGKILRLDVDATPSPGNEYVVPADNPFVSRSGARGEIFSYGMRNAWRCSVDPVTGVLWAGDVGQDQFEEVDRVVSGGNYGWNRREGLAAYSGGSGAPADPFIDPVAVYNHSVGQSITGGHVYRGRLAPTLTGSYIYGDFQSGRVFAIADPYNAATVSDVLSTGLLIASFGVDRAGELYVCAFDGRVLQLQDDQEVPPPTSLPATLSAIGAFSDLPALEPTRGALRYLPKSALWADGASKSRFLLLPTGTAMTWNDVDAFGVPEGALAVKTFSRAGVRLETRVILRTTVGFEAASYRWRSDLSDADRVDVRTDVDSIARGSWTFPSRDDCRLCHTDSAGFLLGVTAQQTTLGTVRNWRRREVITGAPPPRDQTVARNVGLGGRASKAVRARSYLDANCAFCHRPDDPTNAGLDLRATTPLELTGALDKVPQHGDLGIADARVLAPGDPLRSTLSARMRTLGEGRMPQIATHVVDRRAVRVIDAWIRSLSK